MRCDYKCFSVGYCDLHFNPRTSCEVRLLRRLLATPNNIFQSTHLVWGATCVHRFSFRHLSISIHAPRVRCDIAAWHNQRNSRYFNPRTSCEVRLSTNSSRAFLLSFQSTHLVWGATNKKSRKARWIIISIHAPRVRCDSAFLLFPDYENYFNPRTSCEVRRRINCFHPSVIIISIHAPRVRCDTLLGTLWLTISIFQSTHLVWGATYMSLYVP